MSNEQGYVTLKGVELRKTALEAAGIRVERWSGIYRLLLPDGTPMRFQNGLGLSGFMEIEVWQQAPAVESSVDAALKWLTLDEGYFWKHVGYVVELSQPGWTAYICKGDDPKVHYIADSESLSDAMCQAYLQYKGGA